MGWLFSCRSRASRLSSTPVGGGGSARPLGPTALSRPSASWRRGETSVLWTQRAALAGPSWSLPLRVSPPRGGGERPAARSRARLARGYRVCVAVDGASGAHRCVLSRCLRPSGGRRPRSRRPPLVAAAESAGCVPGQSVGGSRRVSLGPLPPTRAARAGGWRAPPTSSLRRAWVDLKGESGGARALLLVFGRGWWHGSRGRSWWGPSWRPGAGRPLAASPVVYLGGSLFPHPWRRRDVRLEARWWDERPRPRTLRGCHVRSTRAADLLTRARCGRERRRGATGGRGRSTFGEESLFSSDPGGVPFWGTGSPNRTPLCASSAAAPPRRRRPVVRGQSSLLLDGGRGPPAPAVGAGCRSWPTVARASPL